jgi:hypothetical protein
MCRKMNYLVSFVLLLCFMLASIAEGADPSLVGLWKLDETEGSIAADSSGNGNNGTVLGDPQWVQGQINGALDFDGDGDYVNCGNAAILGDMDELTVCAWVTIRSIQGDWRVIVAKGENAWRLSNVNLDPRFHFGITWWQAPDTYSVDGATVVGYDEWHHACGTFDGTNINVYLDGVPDGSSSTTEPIGTASTDTLISENPESTGRHWDGLIDDVRVYDRALTEGEIQAVMLGDEEPGRASEPYPENEVNDICRDVVLSWTPGEYADTHDVYFGSSFEDVNSASRTSDPLGLLVSQGQSDNSYDPNGLLAYGQTCYWRIDEVNAPPDSTIYPGEIWSFTVEPFVYQIMNITATASSSQSATMGPEKTIDGSGLNDSDQHSTNITEMWVSSATGPQPTWIQYEFDRVYKLHEMRVWNSNTALEAAFGLGMKEVTIEYSTDANEWMQLGGVHEFARAPGTEGYIHNTEISFDGAVAKYVKINANSNWGGTAQFSLSEVRFLYKPVNARYPEPDINETDVSLDSVLSWRAGREAATHEVYLSTDEQAVTEGTVAAESVPAGECEASFTPLSLELGQTYYWKVNEVNSAESPALWKGDTWSFSTIEYSVVDYFEDYNDTEPDRIFDAWADGWQIAENGSQVGYSTAPFAEQSIVHGGSQSMPFGYNNTGSATYSEATRTFIAPQDWTAVGAQMLTFFFWGDPQAFVDLSAGNILMSGMGADIYDTTDEFRYAYKLLEGDGSITAKIESIQYTDDWAKAGVMMRSGLTALDLQVDMICAPSGRVEWMYRSSAGGATTEADTGEGSITLPHWVKLTRQGRTFTGHHSTDGVNWVSITEGDPTSSSVDILMPSPVYIGLVVTSHVTDVVCQAEFSEVSTTGNVTGDWQLADVGVTQNTGNEPEQLYVSIEDSSGTSKAYEHPDNPNAVLLSGWQQWDIPFSVFSDAGVDLTSVQKLSIGVGDQAAPLNGTGTLYIDDVWLYSPLPTEPDPNATL